jgi:asparagine synthase (glutamine-hydrolysing)
MCGLAGYLSFAAQQGLAEKALRMAKAIRHRGRDDAGVWADEHISIALGHRRLSIVDLSTAGHHPMLSASGQFATTFNGEIYNHSSLRAELHAEGAAPACRGHSDT